MDYMIDIFYKDKSQRSSDVNEFQLKSRTFQIHPLYTQENGAKNYDICLVQTESNEFGIRPDLSTSFDAIPCMPENFDLEQVNLLNSKNM